MKIIKRTGAIVAFDPNKIGKAIEKAYAKTVPYMTEKDYKCITDVAKKVIKDMYDLQIEHIPISVIQNFVEQRLLDFGLFHVAEQYIGYRLQQDISRYGYGDQVIVHFKLERNK